MAGHIVKWWKHKILGGYHKFSVLQECPTDSEELMYHQVRAQSSCSAPPDLLLVSDRESNQHQQHLKSPTSNGTSPSPKRIENSQQQQQQQQNTHHNNKENSKKLIASNHENTALATVSTPLNGDHHNHNNHHHHHQHRSKITSNAGENVNCEKSKDKNIKNSTSAAAADQEIHLEEFTCDVSVEGGKSTQPIQFSFTFYDLDGHHGKITKDDIVGIVYTIYESIGKSVVVPHCGSKTINVRLTVSPESKSKQNQQKSATDVIIQHHHKQHRIRPRKLIKSEEEDEESASEKDDNIKIRNQLHQTHHYKKKLSEHKRKLRGAESSRKEKEKEKECCFELNEKLNHLKIESQSGSGGGGGGANISRQNKQEKEQNESNNCNNLINIDCNEKEDEETSKESDDGGLLQNNLTVQKCIKHRVKPTRRIKKEKHIEHHNTEMRRRSLSVGNECNWRKRQDIKSSRLHSGGNGSNFENGNIVNHDTVDGDCRLEFRNNGLKRNELIDIIRESMEKNRLCFQSNGKPQASVSPMRHHQYHRQRSNTVSKIPTAINTHIYDVAGEKTQSLLGGGSPGINNNNNNSSKHHHQQHQIYSSPQLLYHQPTATSFQVSSASIVNTPLNTNSNSGPHIPIYHQQLAINPVILSAVQNNIQANLEKTSHTKQNLCGYDSFLHAKMCSNNTTNGKSSGSIQNSPNHFHVPNNNHHHVNNTKTTKSSRQLIKLSSPYFNENQQQQQSPSINLKQQNSLNIQESHLQNSQGYHRLNSSNQSHAATTTTTTTTATTAKKLNTALLNIISPQLTAEEKLCRTIDHVEKWLNEHGASISNISDDKYSKKDVKNYDNLLYVKLNEKFAQQQQLQQQQQNLQQLATTNNNSAAEIIKVNSNKNIEDNNKENIRKIYHYHQKLLQQQQHQQQLSNSNIVNNLTPVTSNKCNNKNKYISIAAPPITPKHSQQLLQSAIDPIECENLLNTTTSDEEEIEENCQISNVTTPVSPVLAQNSSTQITPIDNVTPIVEDNCNINESINNDHTPPATTSITGDNSCNNSSNSLSMIHRYVHEHIHHHYHHFENKED